VPGHPQPQSALAQPSGKTLDLNFERFASLADEHVLSLRCQLTPLDFDGSIKIQASINGYPENQGFNHWEYLTKVIPTKACGCRSAPELPH